ncbi:MAG: hypothetical protein U9Q63_03865 [Patescibacteria group bacterium]|nr:hypothetical protein [Patescibacteria group bacterium]
MKKLLVLLLPIFLLTGCLARDKSMTKTVGDKVKEKTKSYTYKSLKTAVKLGIPLKCTYQVGQMEYEGYLKGESWRGTMQQSGKTTNIIMKDNCMYMWANDNPNGSKMCFEEDIWEAEDAQFEQPNMEYICSPAIFGDDKFTPPSSIKFMDLSSMMQGMPSSENQLPDNFPTDGSM